jgi:hypothetical protein
VHSKTPLRALKKNDAKPTQALQKKENTKKEEKTNVKKVKIDHTFFRAGESNDDYLQH